MTVFVVTLVLGMLGAVGVFAARSAQLGVSNAGRYRQMVQTHYVAEGGLQGAVSEFSRDPEAYLKLLRKTGSETAVSGTYGGSDYKVPCKDIPTGIAATDGSSFAIRPR